MKKIMLVFGTRPEAVPAEVKHEYGLDITNKLDIAEKYDAVILGVAHH